MTTKVETRRMKNSPPAGTPVDPSASAPSVLAGVAAHAEPAPRKSSLPMVLWLIGFLAVSATALYVFKLPAMHRDEAFALLDQIPIRLDVAMKRGEDGKIAEQPLMNPVTKQDTHRKSYVAYVGAVSSGDHPDLEARKHFIALADLCGRDPRLAMEVMRIGLKSPMDQAHFQRRMVANEMVILLRDVHDQFPGDPTMLLSMDDMYQVALITNAEAYLTGSARRGADILRLLLAFPVEFPDRVPIFDRDATGKYALAREAYLSQGEYNGRKFREPFVEQGPDILLLLNTYRIEQFRWDDSIRRFLFTGKPMAGAPPTPPPTPTGDPLKGIGTPAPEAPAPAPK
ncbi:MAG TPA: hypothetical protein VL860_02945 [Planctomycetota bacterium]|nr:hypothetical protein [Planctomycetota bacterium]